MNAYIIRHVQSSEIISFVARIRYVIAAQPRIIICQSSRKKVIKFCNFKYTLYNVFIYPHDIQTVTNVNCTYEKHADMSKIKLYIMYNINIIVLMLYSLKYK